MKLARVNLEAEVWGDPRFPHLERLLGYPPCSGHLAIARMAKVWGWQVEHYTPDAPCFHVPEEVIEMALEVEGERAVAALVRANLAELTPDGVRVRGSSHEATGWLYRVRARSADAVAAKRAKAAQKRNATYNPQPQVHHGSTTGQPQVNPLSSLLSDQIRDLSLVDRAREAGPTDTDPEPQPEPEKADPRPEAPPALAPLARLVTLAARLLNDARSELDPAARPVVADMGDEMAAAACLRPLPEHQREPAVRHGVAAIAAAVRVGREPMDALRPGELFGPRSWKRWQAATTDRIERAARGRDGPAGRQSPARGQAIAQPDLPRTDGDVTL